MTENIFSPGFRLHYVSGCGSGCLSTVRLARDACSLQGQAVAGTSSSLPVFLLGADHTHGVRKHTDGNPSGDQEPWGRS